MLAEQPPPSAGLIMPGSLPGGPPLARQGRYGMAEVRRVHYVVVLAGPQHYM